MAYSNSLNALADPTRREVFERLRARPRAVGELAAELPVSRPAVSQHLRVLKDAGLVSDEQVGTRRVYRIEPAGLSELRDWVDGFWKDALATFQSAVENESSTKRRKQ
jgi:DNA-binding transcriptional ArsR family regulator